MAHPNFSPTAHTPPRGTTIEPPCIRANPWDAGCPSRQILELVANKWVLLIMPLLARGSQRNAELLRGVEGISQKMLTQTLRALERHGLVAREDFGESPPRVEYRLTPLGASLSGTVALLDAWVVDNFAALSTARRSYRRPPTPSRVRIP
jgi:DNA-binding HxlR family transcriptional regulator